MLETTATTRIVQLTPAQGIYAEYAVADGLPGETIFEKVHAWALMESDFTGVVGLVYWNNEDGDPYLTPATETGGFLGYKTHKQLPDYKRDWATPKNAGELLAVLPSTEIRQQHLTDAWPALQRCDTETLMSLACGALLVFARKTNTTPEAVLTAWVERLKKRNEESG
jgi:hypothetical protein